MKKSIYLYLFIFSVLINIFTYMFFTSQGKADTERITKIQTKLKTVRDSVRVANEKNLNENYFSLENNDNAKEYFNGQDVKAIAIKVRDAAYAKNAVAGGNPLVGYPMMESRPFTISKIKVLNHRWAIADFSNGKQWGEALLKYFVEEDGSITLEKVESTLYPFTPY